MTSVTITGGSGRWEARAGDEPAGVLRALERPDRRCYLSFRDCRPEAYPPLLAAASSYPQDLYVTVDEADAAGRERFGATGFAVWRREHVWRVPTDPARFRLPDVRPPSGVEVVSAGEADLERLRELDEAVRADIPGGEGWRWTPEEFREETFSDGYDPATYRVAVATESGEHIGFFRVWMKAAGPRIGCLGVRRAYRRTRVVPALLGPVLREVHAHGHPTLTTETDTTNRPVNALLARAGAERTGGLYHLVRRRP